jgi:hypothetical protein
MSRRPTTLRFRIRSWDEQLDMPCDCHVTDCGHEGRVVWEVDLVDKRLAEEIWQQIAARNKPRNDVNVQEAEEFLSGLMTAGVIEMTPGGIFKLAKADGITKSAVKRAKDRMNLVSKRAAEFPAPVIGWQIRKADL